MTAWLDDLLVCPSCRKGLQHIVDSYRCQSCSVQYPVRFGIPDFRLQPDPFISIEDEIKKIELMLVARPGTFSEFLEQYYRLSPENPPRLHRHYIAAMNAAVCRGAALLHKLESRFPAQHLSLLLDLGCGTGGMTVAASRRYPRVVGMDVALRWLVIGRQRLREEGVQAPLVCANAEFQPFQSDRFDAVVADSVLEHVRDSARTRDELLRVLRPQGVFFLTTNNRYSILPEPHVRIFGFALLPRKWREPLAQLLRKTPYKANLHSRKQLKSLFQNCGEVMLPFFTEDEWGGRSRRLLLVWNKIREITWLACLVRGIVPMYFVVGRKPPRQRTRH
jgi:ubiquinone/menaquinone biosynthesis C-methylase UbiE/uncharacterized protein YbaR (Trm112 family)